MRSHCMSQLIRHLLWSQKFSLSTPRPREHSARMHWHTAGRGDTCLLAQTLCKVREDEEQVLLYWPNRTWFPEVMLLMTVPPWRISLRKDLLSQRVGTLWHPHPDLWKLHVYCVSWQTSLPSLQGGYNHL